MYAYPTAKTGTSQDLMNIVARACEDRINKDGTVLPVKTAAQRACFSAPFNLAGAAVHAVMSCLPAEWALAGHDKLFRTLAGAKTYPFDVASPVLGRAAKLVADVEQETGQTPALLALISHPPVWGDAAHMNFELVRHAMLGLRRLRGAPCRPRLVVAVDLFALDSISVPEEGLYAGYMGLHHLGFDRLSIGRGRASAAVVGETAWSRMARRLLRDLGLGREVGMVLAGGVPATTRVLYAAREWVQAQRRLSPLRRRPSEVLARLRGLEGFRAFEAAALVGPRLQAKAWRMLEGWVMWELAGLSATSHAQTPAADSGSLTPAARSVLAGCVEALDLASAQGAEAISGFAAEFTRETPYRARFFRLLAGRVLERGRPLVFLPVVHRLGDAPGIDFRDAWAWTGGDRDRLAACSSASTSQAFEGSPEGFAVRFGQENFA